MGARHTTSWSRTSPSVASLLRADVRCLPSTVEKALNFLPSRFTAVMVCFLPVTCVAAAANCNGNI